MESINTHKGTNSAIMITNASLKNDKIHQTRMQEAMAKGIVGFLAVSLLEFRA
ncbi:hypothetical protein [Helicobacter fennelliae]|uniref:hypothetical protein n=1 Tax=Helicobacter fennelliae TaxID=215 RepID=UPI000E01A73E|nr:hypothetical protein [Helicobacter fennelliae]STQ83322.1 Uncharacterised protein [Helicobacter fennelliae]